MSLPDFTVSLKTGGAMPCGTLTFGPPTTFPEPTDPEVAPPGLPNTTVIVPGFTYTSKYSSATNDRIDFTISLAEPWRPWCQLQTPHCDQHLGGFYCSDAATWDVTNDTTCRGRDSTNQDLGPVACAQAVICRGGGSLATCACDAHGCDGSQRADIAFEFFLQGDIASGWTGSSPVVLTRN